MKPLQLAMLFLLLYVSTSVQADEADRKNIDLDIEQKVISVSVEDGQLSEENLRIASSITKDPRDITPSLLRLMDEKYSPIVRGRALSFLESRDKLGDIRVVDFLLNELDSYLKEYYKAYAELEIPEKLTVRKKPVKMGDISEEEMAEIIKLELTTSEKSGEALEVVRSKALNIGTIMSNLRRSKSSKALDRLVKILVEPKELLMSDYCKRDIVKFAAESGDAGHLVKIRTYRKSLDPEDTGFIHLLDESIRTLEERLGGQKPDPE